MNKAETMRREVSFDGPAEWREPVAKSGVSASMREEALGQYFASREQDERALSREAYDWRVAAAHAELADRYEALAAVFGAKRLNKLPIDYL